jgi:DNA (cytosine-5)-methyltransferase 1
VKPRVLDLFCGAGGASMGYHRAGFEVVGVDNRPQPRYPFEFHQADALSILRGMTSWPNFNGELWRPGSYQAVHASPPCQAFTALQRAAGRASDHPDLVAPTRDLLAQIGLPYIIENVPGAPLRDPYLFCGASFGLQVVRHRLFELSWPMLVPPCAHVPGGTTTGRYVAFRQSGDVAPGRTVPPRRTEREFRAEMGCEWMTLRETSQAIPPVFTEFIGEQLLHHLYPPGAAVLPTKTAAAPGHHREETR